MKPRAVLMRYFRGPATDEPVSLRFDAPTVTPDMRKALDAQPVTILGERWIKPKPPVQRLDVQSKLAAVDYEATPV